LIAEDLTVVITTIPVRRERLEKAVLSVENQTLQPQELIVQNDLYKEGAPANRDNGIAKVTTKYVALLDDDDYFYPDHLETLYNAAIDNDADIVYSWFDVIGGTDPFPENFGKPWNPEIPIQTTVTILAKTGVIRKAGGYTNQHNLSLEELGNFAQGNTAGEDFRMVFTANKQGAKIIHVPKKTWAYCHWTTPEGTVGNTSGSPDRW
jgi:glycosyltransferase involved in cell wall biosynthesis